MRTYQLLYYNLQHQIFETLVAIDFNTQKITPVLAESWNRINDKTIRFYLRKGVRFHNSEPFTSKAVKFSLDLMKDPQNKFAGRYLLNSIQRIEIIDDYTVDIIMDCRDVLLLRKLASIAFILPPEYYKKVGSKYFTRHPMGTGPFRFFYIDGRSNHLEKIHFVANEDYWQTDTPSFKELVFHFIPYEKQWEALKNNSIDMIITQYCDPETDFTNNKNIKIFKGQTLRNSACILNIDKRGPLSDLRVRKALQHCINRRNIINKAVKGYGTPLYSTAPKGALGHSADTPVYTENIAHAKSLMQRAGYPDGFTLKILACDTVNTVGIVNTLEEQFKQIGVNLDVSFLNREEIMDEIISPKLKGSFKPSKFDMWVLSGWPNIFGTGANFYFLFLNSHGMFNFGIHVGKDSPIDNLYNKAMQSRDKKCFSSNLQDLDHYLISESLVIPLYQVEVIYGMKKDFKYDPGLNDLPHRFYNCTIVE